MMGKGIDRGELEALGGKVFVVGDCACDEVQSELTGRLGRKAVRAARGCNNLRDVLGALTPLMGVSPLKMVPLPALESLVLLAKARLRRTTALITPIIPKG